MAEVSLARNAGHWGQILVPQVTLTVAAGQTSATYTTTKDYNGLVWKVEIKPQTLTASASLKAHDTSTILTAPAYFLEYTVPNPAVEKLIYPNCQRTTSAGTAITGLYDAYPVAGPLKFDLTSATAADSVTIRVYIMG